jgi:hypothetical protein
MPGSAAAAAAVTAPPRQLTHDKVHLWHPPQQLLPLLLRYTASNNNLKVAHAVTLALGLQTEGTSESAAAAAGYMHQSCWLLGYIIWHYNCCHHPCQPCSSPATKQFVCGRWVLLTHVHSVLLLLATDVQKSSERTCLPSAE